MSAAPMLFLPKKIPVVEDKGSPNGICTPGEYHRQQQQRREKARTHEFAGRNVGKPHGTFVTDEAEQQLCIILCSKCKHKFDSDKYNYYLTREFRIRGRCDGCKASTQDANFFIHETRLGLKHGQCWEPR